MYTLQFVWYQQFRWALLFFFAHSCDSRHCWNYFPFTIMKEKNIPTIQIHAILPWLSCDLAILARTCQALRKMPGSHCRRLRCKFGVAYSCQLLDLSLSFKHGYWNLHWHRSRTFGGKSAWRSPYGSWHFAYDCITPAIIHLLWCEIDYLFSAARSNDLIPTQLFTKEVLLDIKYRSKSKEGRAFTKLSLYYPTIANFTVYTAGPVAVSKKKKT